MVQQLEKTGTAWTHVTISVSNLDRSIEFYKSYCNLSVVRDVRKNGGTTVWLGHGTGSSQNPRFVLVLLPEKVTDHVNHLGFQCETKEEVDKIAERAKQEGCLHSGPDWEEISILGYWIWIKDPDEHIVEFTYGQPLEELKN